MKRYIVDKKANNVLNLNVLDAQTELASDKTITNEALGYRHIPYISVVLSEEQLQILRENNISYEEEVIQENVLLSENTGYEKLRSLWFKTTKRALTGQGTKVGVLDTGCALSVVPYDFAYNFINNNTDVTDVFGHGTIVCSIIKHPVIAVAPNCELHILKVISDGGIGNESAILAGVDYAISNSLDVVNFSWTFDTTAVRAAILTLVSGNCVVSAASGNSSSPADTVVPACLPGVVAVNAADSLGNPGFKNVNVPSGISGAHGVTLACNGVGCQGYNTSGNLQGVWGTSFAAPFFTGMFAIYKEQLGVTDNQKVLQFILNKVIKHGYSNYLGRGLPTF